MAITTGISIELALTPIPQIIVHQDNSMFPTGITLDETNYSLWSQLMEMRIGARNKASYLTEKGKNQHLEIPILEGGLPKITK